jgi:HPt (histidine-containing phosphotransfer) domain-containing protein
MDRESCIAAGIDYDSGLARFAGKADLYEKFLKKFPADTTFTDLEKAMADGDTRAAFIAAHTLKGVTGNLSLNGLYTGILPLVEALRGDGNMELAKTLYPPVKEEYDKEIRFLTEQES